MWQGCRGCGVQGYLLSQTSSTSGWGVGAKHAATQWERGQPREVLPKKEEQLDPELAGRMRVDAVSVSMAEITHEELSAC